MSERMRCEVENRLSRPHCAAAGSKKRDFIPFWFSYSEPCKAAGGNGRRTGAGASLGCCGWPATINASNFSIPPGNEDATVTAVFPVSKPALLYSLSPHMHLRGSWMRYEALYPNGKRETLLSVPHYDFNWQTSYQFPQPKKLPAGTWIVCTGGFDNSSLNPANPDPAKRVAWGDQSFDEMFIGFMEMAEIPKPRTDASR